jgi:hypothetical protein
MRNLINAEAHQGALNIGTSKPQLITDENFELWLMKSAGSFQGPVGGARLLFNEYFATRVAQELGMPVVPVACVQVSREFLDNNPRLRLPEFGNFIEGLHFACQFREGLPLISFEQSGQVAMLATKTMNWLDSNAVTTFDTWVFNADRAYDYQSRHFENSGNLLFENVAQGLYRMLMIDHGLAFSGDWHDDPNLEPAYRVGNWALALFGHMDLFFKHGWITLAECQNWMQKISLLSLSQLQNIVAEVPAVWKQGISVAEINALLGSLLTRSQLIGNLFTTAFTKAQSEALAR